MFDSLVIGYLFLGGAGGGAVVVLAALEGVRAFAGRRLGLPNEFFARAWPVSTVVLAAGIVCIFADLGRPDRLFALVLSPQPTPLTVGAYALVVSLACAGAFSVLALADGLHASRAARVALAAAALVAGLATAAYTGVLLQGLASVLFWQTPLLPAAFVLSSLSCGLALALGVAAFVEARRPFMRPLAWLARADGALIVLEAACLAAYLVWGFADGGTRWRQATWRPRSGAAWRRRGLRRPLSWSACSRTATTARSCSGSPHSCWWEASRSGSASCRRGFTT